MEGFAGRDRVFCRVGESSWRASVLTRAVQRIRKRKEVAQENLQRDRQEHGWYDFSGGCAGTALERGDEGGPVCRAPDQANRQRRDTSEQPFPGQPVSMSFSGSLLRTLALAVRKHMHAQAATHHILAADPHGSILIARSKVLVVWCRPQPVYTRSYPRTGYW